MRRLVEETACQHSYFGGCTFKTDSGDPCPGGTSREVGIAPQAALDSLRTLFYPNEYSEGYALEAVTHAIDAALGVGS